MPARRLLRCLPHSRLDERAESAQQRPKPSEKRSRLLPTYAHHPSKYVDKARYKIKSWTDTATEIGHEKAQSVIDSITASYTDAGQASQNPMLPGNGPMGAGPFNGIPPPFAFPPGGKRQRYCVLLRNRRLTDSAGMPPPPFGAPGGMPGPAGRGMPPFPFPPPNGMPFPPPGGLPFPPPTPGTAGSPTAGMPFLPPPGAPGALPFPPPNMAGGMPFPPPVGGPSPIASTPIAAPPGASLDPRRQ